MLGVLITVTDFTADTQYPYALETIGPPRIYYRYPYQSSCVCRVQFP